MRKSVRNFHILAVLNYLFIVWVLWIMYGTEQGKMQKAEAEKPNRRVVAVKRQ